MKAGRELDALVAEKVMGIVMPAPWPADAPKLNPIDPLHRAIAFARTNAVLDAQDPKHYSTNIAAAWDVVEKMCPVGINESGFCPQFELTTNKGCERSWTAQFYDRFGNAWWAKNKEGEIHFGHGETAPLAICLAALAACGVKIEKT